MKPSLRPLFLVLAALLLLLASPVYALENMPEPVHVRARVVYVGDMIEETYAGGMFKEQPVQVKILQGEFKGQVVDIRHSRIEYNPAYDIEVKEGTEVILWLVADSGGIVEAHIDSIARDKSMAWLAAAYLGSLVIVGGKKGLRTAVSLIFTVGVIMKVLLPMLLKGYDPVLLAVGISAVVASVTILLVGGRGKKALSAICGTTGGVLIAGIVAKLVGKGAQLTGFGTEEASMLLYIPQEIQFDYRGLLFAGILIGALGAVMDVAVSVASAMSEIRQASPDMPRSRLFASGMNVGRDVMGTMSNTLILAYAGGAIPLLLLFLAYDTPFGYVINLDIIATEVVRALAGSLGLIMAIPLTAAVSSYLLGSGSTRPDIS